VDPMRRKTEDYRSERNLGSLLEMITCGIPQIDALCQVQIALSLASHVELDEGLAKGQEDHCDHQLPWKELRLSVTSHQFMHQFGPLV
jgi:hypothetical protein